MTLIGETMGGQIIEVGQTDGNAYEFVVEIEGSDHLLHIPCTAPVAREAGAHLYEPMHITFNMIAHPAPAPETTKTEGDDRE